jgi:hypothetical protein
VRRWQWIECFAAVLNMCGGLGTWVLSMSLALAARRRAFSSSNSIPLLLGLLSIAHCKAVLRNLYSAGEPHYADVLLAPLQCGVGERSRAVELEA